MFSSIRDVLGEEFSVNLVRAKQFGGLDVVALVDRLFAIKS